MPGANHDGPESSSSARVQAPQVETPGGRSVTFEPGGTLEPPRGTTDETDQTAVSSSTSRIAERIQPDLEHELESFRKGDISRAEATRRILRAFEATGLPESARDDGETHYLDQLEEIRRQRNSRLERGSIRNGPGIRLDGQTESTGTLDTQAPVSSGPSGANLRPLSSGVSNPFLNSRLNEQPSNDPAGGMRPVNDELSAQAEQLLASIEHDHAASRDEAIEEFYKDDTGRKRRRVLESEMPWFTNGTTSMSDGNPAAAPTRKIINDLGKNLSESKRFLHIAPNLPAGFPSSEWDNILTGRYVNFDVVYGAVRFDAGTREYKQGSSSSEGLPELRQTPKVVNDVNSWYELLDFRQRIRPDKQSPLKSER
ncbi:hypothetical protein H0H92_009676 [Tricholoma furcatifolium]|nr:hypothetical protein H0H92_009676 [Tricholoma furcatifolium]